SGGKRCREPALYSTILLAGRRRLHHHYRTGPALPKNLWGKAVDWIGAQTARCSSVGGGVPHPDRGCSVRKDNDFSGGPGSIWFDVLPYISDQERHAERVSQYVGPRRNSTSIGFHVNECQLRRDTLKCTAL